MITSTIFYHERNNFKNPNFSFNTLNTPQAFEIWFLEILKFKKMQKMSISSIKILEVKNSNEVTRFYYSRFYLNKTPTMKKMIFFSILAIFSFNIWAQEIPNVVPPSPEAEAFQKYGDIPVSTYTGIPNISIPLYTVTEGDISIPISLSYHASGIKVDEEASRVGLGWVLNTGGIISRTVVGKDDFAQINGYHNGGIPNLSIASIADSFNPVQYGYDIELPGTGELPVSDNYVNNEGEMFDFQPDHYTYNFMGYSGKFILKPNKEVVLATKEKIEIKCMDANATTWEIKTPNGMHYFFEVYETYQQENNADVKSSWYLKRIESPKGDIVELNYFKEANTFIRPVGSYFEKRYDYYQFTGQAECTPGSRQPIETHVAGKYYDKVRLTSIDFDMGTVEFVYGSRLDIANDSKVEKIRIFRKVDNIIESESLKDFTFDYDYFETDRDADFNAFEIVDKRLKLLSVTELGRNSTGSVITNPPYRFKYFENYMLPAKSSFARDHWGYYNGKLGNESLIPSFTAISGDYSIGTLLGAQGSERDTNPSTIKACSLEEIIYPTGGSTEFFFEVNDYDAESSNLDLNTTQPYKVVPKQLVYDSNDSSSGSQQLDLSDMYVDNNGNFPVVKLNAFFRLSDYDPQQPMNYNVYFRLLKENGTLEHEISTALPLCGANSPNNNGGCLTFDGYFYRYTNEFVTLQPGKYTWQASIQNNNQVVEFEDISSTYTYFAVNSAVDNGPKGLLRNKLTTFVAISYSSIPRGTNFFQC